MSPIVINFLLLYLLMPIIGVILGAVMFVIAKKNKLLDNKKAIFYFLISIVILAAPALLGFIHYWFMPYAYTGLLILYLFLGYYNLKVLKKIVPALKEKPYYIEFIFVFVLTIVSACIFSLVFNLCNELKYGLWACTCLIPFLFATLFLKAYKSYMDIPIEIYQKWSYYNEHQEMTAEFFDPEKIIVVELEMFKNVQDLEPLNIKAKSSEITPFGIWFKTFLDDYNKKSPNNPIVYSDQANSYGWTFYTLSSIFGRKKYIDASLSFAENKIKEKNVILAKRVKFDGENID